MGRDESVEVFDGEDTRTLVGFEVGLAEKVAVTISQKSLVPAGVDDVVGGTPDEEEAFVLGHWRGLVESLLCVLLALFW